MVLYGILLNGTWCVGNDFNVMAWTNRDSATSWLRRYAPNWYQLGARVAQLADTSGVTIRGTSATKAIVRRVAPNTHPAITTLDGSVVQRNQVCWVVQWQSPSMPGPSFWYYATRKAARAEARALKKGSKR